MHVYTSTYSTLLGISTFPNVKLIHRRHVCSCTCTYISPSKKVFRQDTSFYTCTSTYSTLLGNSIFQNVKLIHKRHLHSCIYMYIYTSKEGASVSKQDTSFYTCTSTYSTLLGISTFPNVKLIHRRHVCSCTCTYISPSKKVFRQDTSFYTCTSTYSTLLGNSIFQNVKLIHKRHLHSCIYMYIYTSKEGASVSKQDTSFYTCTSTYSTLLGISTFPNVKLIHRRHVHTCIYIHTFHPQKRTPLFRRDTSFYFYIIAQC